MTRTIQNTRGQSTLEYAILIVIVAAALISIQTFVNRGLQGRMRQATDDIGDQYSGGNTETWQNSWTNSERTSSFKAGVDKTTTTRENTWEYTTSNIADYEETWGQK